MSIDFFFIGVSVSFLGGALDSLYWMFPWTLSFADSPEAGQWVDTGVYFNIVFRQTADLLAAWLHVYSFRLHLKEEGLEHPIERWINKVAISSVLAGLAYVIVLRAVSGAA